MADMDSTLFNIAAFIAGLFVLEFGADAFVDHTATVARRCGVSPTLVALLTAGAEWEELAVVVASLSLHRQDIALGNVLGSAISNILGAFSLGLVFTAGTVRFDASARIYTSVLFALTTVVAFLGLLGSLNGIVGGLLIAGFVVYFVSIGWAIYRGVMEAPVDSDSDSDSDSDDDDNAAGAHGREAAGSSRRASETSALLPSSENSSEVVVERMGARSLTYHITHLIFGFLALSLSGYILSHAASTLAGNFNISGTVLGITILSFATTLPEKLVAIISGQRGHHGIVVANTAGSNIFLLSLCLGVTLVSRRTEEHAANFFEIMSLWLSSALLFLIVWFGGNRWLGWGMLVLYVLFIVLEFTLFRR